MTSSIKVLTKITKFWQANTTPSDTSQAFTLIELLVGISIMAIVFTIGIANYRDFSRRQALVGVEKTLKGDLRTAQQLALAGKKPEGSTCDVLNGYTFALTGSSGYRISANCSNGLGTSSIEYKLVSLSGEFSISSTNPTVEFKVLGHGTNLVSANTFTLSHTAGMQTTIVLGIGGDVR